MKQYINPEQLKELSSEKQEVLTKWFMEKGYDDESTMPLLTIGQMIEFLDENATERYSRLAMARAPSTVKGFVRKWIIGQYNEGFEDAEMIEELCDALWVTVKKILMEGEG